MELSLLCLPSVELNKETVSTAGDTVLYPKCREPGKVRTRQTRRERPLPALGRVHPHTVTFCRPNKRRFQDPDAYKGFLWPSHRSGSLDGAL